MGLLRLATILWTTLRHGLDLMAMDAFAPAWLARLWRGMMAWRSMSRPRGERLRAALEHLGPLFVKFGQVLSTRQDVIPKDLASALGALQDKVRPQPIGEIKTAIEASYGRPLAETFASFDDEPLGSASVAQVHRATLLDGTTVAVKVLRPNIGARVDRDIRLMLTCAAVVEMFHPEAHRLRPRDLVDEFRRSLAEEIDLLHEAANCNQLRRNLAGDANVRIPRVHWDHCTSQVMVMELLDGIPIDQTATLVANDIDLERLARTGIEVFFTQVFRDSFFHADMHPGNLLVGANGEFVVLDFGIMGSLAEIDKEYIGANFLAFLNRDYRGVARMHVEAGWVPSDTSVPQFEAAIRAVCEPIFARPLREISFGRLLLQLFRVARRFNLVVQPQLILLQKTLLNIEGIGRQLAPDLNLWDSAKPFLEEWARGQRSPKRAARMLREAAPSLLALLPQLPMAARNLLTSADTSRHGERERHRDRRRLRRWRLACVLLAVAVVVLVTRGW